jgi:hypothetical protein
MASGRRQVFIYYRVRLAQSDTAIDAAHRMQQTLCDRWPGLRVALMRRPDTDNTTEVTLMETYALDAAVAPHGIDHALQDHIEALAQAELGTFISGARHVEVFDTCA